MARAGLVFGSTIDVKRTIFGEGERRCLDQMARAGPAFGSTMDENGVVVGQMDVSTTNLDWGRGRRLLYAPDA